MTPLTDLTPDQRKCVERGYLILRLHKRWDSCRVPREWHLKKYIRFEGMLVNDRTYWERYRFTPAGKKALRQDSQGGQK